MPGIEAPPPVTAAPPALVRALVWLLPVALGVAFVFPHLSDEAWYDEAFTLDYFATSPGRAFESYKFPNNHVLFSSALGAWRGMVGESEPALRLFPVVTFLVAIGLLATLLHRLGGPVAAVLGATMFATSHATLNFAAQLRGYGPSWLPVVGAALALVVHSSRPRAWLLVVAVLCEGIAVGILPTNVLALAPISAWVAGRALMTGDWRTPAGALRVAAACLGPALGLLAYVPVWADFIHLSRTMTTTATRSSALLDAARGMALLAFAAPAAVGLYVLSRSASADPDTAPSAPRSRLLFVVLALAAPVLLFLVSPRTPFARNLVPALPLAFGALGLLIVEAARAMTRNRSASQTPALVGGLALLIALAAIREGTDVEYKGRNPEGSADHGICDQYFHHHFHPSVATEVALRELNSGPGYAFTDTSDLWALHWAGGEALAPYLKLIDPQMVTPGRKSFDGKKVLFLTAGRARADRLAYALGLAGGEHLHLVQDTGFFDVYEWRP